MSYGHRMIMDGLKDDIVSPCSRYVAIELLQLFEKEGITRAYCVFSRGLGDVTIVIKKFIFIFIDNNNIKVEHLFDRVPIFIVSLTQLKSVCIYLKTSGIMEKTHHFPFI